MAAANSELVTIAMKILRAWQEEDHTAVVDLLDAAHDGGEDPMMTLTKLAAVWATLIGGGEPFFGVAFIDAEGNPIDEGMLDESFVLANRLVVALSRSDTDLVMDLCRGVDVDQLYDAFGWVLRIAAMTVHRLMEIDGHIYPDPSVN